MANTHFYISSLLIFALFLATSCKRTPNSSLEVVEKGSTYIVLKGKIDKIPDRHSVSVVYGMHNVPLSYSDDEESVSGRNNFTVRIGGLCPNTTYYFSVLTFFSVRDYTVGSQRLAVTTDTLSAVQPNAIDLGLSVLWADRNVGAASKYCTGVYYTWGYPYEEKDHCNYDRNYHIEKVCPLHIAGTKYDPATKLYGKDWRLPTKMEIQELYQKCDWKWTFNQGHYGYTVTAKNGNSIFLPAAGYVRRRKLKDYNDNGWYLSDEKSSKPAFSFTKSNKGDRLPQSHEGGYPVRPVKVK